MKFVKFEAYYLDDRLSMQRYWFSYIEIKEIKTFKVAYRSNKKHIIINNQSPSPNIRLVPRYIPVDKNQFKEAFGLDWDEL